MSRYAWIGGVLVAMLSLQSIAAETYKVSLSVSREGALISRPEVIVEGGKKVDLTANLGGSKAYKMIFTVDKSADKTFGDDVADVDSQFFETVNEELVLRGAPKMSVRLGSPATFTLASPGLQRNPPQFDLSVTVERIAGANPQSGAGCPRSSSPLEIGESSSNSDACHQSSGNSLLALLGVSDANAGDGNCCTVRCGGGYLTCCGALSCCEGTCGACCHVP